MRLWVCREPQGWEMAPRIPRPPPQISQPGFARLGRPFSHGADAPLWKSAATCPFPVLGRPPRPSWKEFADDPGGFGRLPTSASHDF